VHFNNITQNGSYSIYLNDQIYDIPAQNNWWGTSNLSDIGDLVWDHSDDARAGVVFIEPILTAPADSAGPRFSFELRSQR
jgi:hypothetical protein